MHYYKRNIGDYHKKAGRLSMLQHGAYTLLIDSCYDRENFPTLDEAIEWTWASTIEEIEAVKFVLAKFFTLQDGIYIQKRVKEELAKFHENSKTNKRIAIERETKRRENNTNREQSVHEPPPNQEPRTKNQEPNTNTNTLVASKLADDCPHEQIIAIYHEVLPELPAVRIWNEKRKNSLRSRWREDKKRQDLDWWRDFFKYISESDFLTGRANGFQANLEWIVNSSNIVKIIEGNYDNRKQIWTR